MAVVVTTAATQAALSASRRRRREEKKKKDKLVMDGDVIPLSPQAKWNLCIEYNGREFCREHYQATEEMQEIIAKYDQQRQVIKDQMPLFVSCMIMIPIVAILLANRS